MKFHAVHGCNVTTDENGKRASRTSSFCDAIAFSYKPLAINARVSLLLGSNEDWTGALRIGVTTQDPATFVNKTLPRYACPDLTSKNGFWARPLPEAWTTNGAKLTFYVNSKGHLHLFVNSEHKGAILIGIPVKEQLWVILDLYGTTVSVKFISNSGNAPSEVVARGPDAIQAYQYALTSGSTSYYHTRIALIGPPDGKKTLLKKLLVEACEDTDVECDGIDTTVACQTSDNSRGQPWVKAKIKKYAQDYTNGNLAESVEDSNPENDDQPPDDLSQVTHSEEEYFKAIATNIVREMILQRKRGKDDRKKTPVSKSAFRLQSSLNKIGSSKGKQEDTVVAKDCKNSSASNEELPTDLPSRVVELVETMLKESESKQFWEKKENEKQYLENVLITFNIWNYSGHVKHLLLHQLFLSPHTIYLYVFDLSQDLEAPLVPAQNYGLDFPSSGHMTYLSLLHLWLEMIYASIAHPKDETKKQIPENQINDIICTLFPPVLIVGVQEDSTTFDSLLCRSLNMLERHIQQQSPLSSTVQELVICLSNAWSSLDLNALQHLVESMLNRIHAVEHQFNKIKESIQDKIYYHLVHPTFYYVGSPETVAVDSMILELRAKIQELSMQLPHVGTEIPLKWMLFEQAVERLIEREVYFADTDKLAEVARLENIESDEEFYSMIHFFHHQGKIWHMGSDMLLGKEDGCGIVILKPQWFINYIYQLMNPNTYNLLKENSEYADNQEYEDVFNSNSFEVLWPNSFHHSTVLLDILDSMDVLCEVMPSEVSSTSESSNLRIYMIPWICEPKFLPNTSGFQGLVLILDFSNLLPVGFFTKLIVRLFRWSKRHYWKRNLNQICNNDMIPVDYNHIIKLRETVGHRIQVCLLQRKYVDTDSGVELSFPAPHVCLKVRHLLERETEHLRDVWYKRLSFSLNVPCPCEKTCNLHETAKCIDPQCVHLLSLDDCLSKKVIECDYRLLKTDFIQKFFNISIIESPRYSSMRLSMDSISTPFLGNFFWSDHDIAGDEPHWLKHVGNALTAVNTGRDWIALAKRLGYSEREIRRFSDETFPSISLLNDWINSNGRTRFCIDMLVTCLEQMGRKDVINCILIELGPELPSPPVFISYQWESQQAVLHIRKRIELAGYPCWMDVGHLVGGDALYGKIYEGINKAKVVLCFLSPRYVLSPLCTREMSLADILRKPIVPIMLEPTPWPPPGALALILSSLVYVDLCGIGGHGGSGRQADWEARFHCIIERLSHFISPSFSSQLTTISSSERLIPPSTVAVIRNPEEFIDTPEQMDEREIDNPAVPLPDEDSQEISAQESISAYSFDTPLRNRVLGCSVCIIL